MTSSTHMKSMISDRNQNWETMTINLYGLTRPGKWDGRGFLSSTLKEKKWLELKCQILAKWKNPILHPIRTTTVDVNTRKPTSWTELSPQKIAFHTRTTWSHSLKCLRGKYHLVLEWEFQPMDEDIHMTTIASNESILDSPISRSELWVDKREWMVC